MDRNQKLWDQFDRLKQANGLEALMAGARVIMLESKKNAPVLTGEVRDSHDVIPFEDGCAITVDTDHSIYPEYGTVKMAARPFLRPAIDNKKAEAVKAVGARMMRIMRTEARGG